MPKRICSIDGCENPYYGRGYCKPHWRSAYYRGDISFTRNDKRERKDRKCSYPDCRNRHHSNGYCTGHNYQIQVGKPLAPLGRRSLTKADRFWQKVRKTDNCWYWTSTLNPDGYGQFYDNDRKGSVGAHRVSYELSVGPIPDGMFIDHICFTVSCVNPAHLRPVTFKQNLEHRNRARIDSQTGVRGVLWDSRWNAYIAKVGHNGETLKWGPFKTIKEADVFVRAKRAELFTHDDADY